MNHTRSGPRSLVALAGIVAILAAACGAASTSPSASTAEASAAPASAAATAEPTPLVTPEPVTALGPEGQPVIRWFVGLGAGGQPQQIAAQTDFVTKFNTDQKDVYLALEIYDNKVAGQHPRDADRGRQRAGHHRTGRASRA